MTSTNYTKLADLYAVAKAELDAAEAKVKELRKAILATGQETVQGDAFSVTVGLSERKTLDKAMVESFLTEEQLASCMKVTLCETLRIKAAVAKAEA